MTEESIRNTLVLAIGCPTDITIVIVAKVMM